MIVELNKKDLVSLVCGVEPSYDSMEELKEDNFGTFSASYDIWDWNRFALGGLSEYDLWELYNKIKKEE